MVSRAYTIVWTKRSQIHLKQIHEFISKHSVQNASKVINDIISAVSKATDNPEVYNADKYKLNNDGSYRAFEIHHFRVAYRFDHSTIRVLRVRHTSMEPDQY